MKTKRQTPGGIQRDIFLTQTVLILALAVVLTAAGLLVNLRAEAVRRDQNLRNVAEAVAHARILTDAASRADEAQLTGVLDTLRESFSSVDVLSVVDAEGRRLYHSNHALIGTVYDGSIPDFMHAQSDYAVDDTGPSGAQRRAYAAIYGDDGSYAGFIIAVMLRENIREETLHILGTFALITAAAVLIELLISYRISKRIKVRLLGFEPDTFSAMYRIRDNILESLDEGVIAVDSAEELQFANRAATAILGTKQPDYAKKLLGRTLQSGEKELGVRETFASGADILIDRIPIMEGDTVAGAVGVLHDRTEYTRLAEDLSGTRYLVDSMRANNHDFTNKLQVILGLIQMRRYDQAAAYIENISMIQREGIRKIMDAVDEPSVAALLIGKTARASELDVDFVLREGSNYRRADVSLPAGALVTILGNLVDNALDAMNEAGRDYQEGKELLLGIYSRPGALLITVDDTGPGIPAEALAHIFKKGYTTKGDGHGTGLYQVKKLTEGLGGTVAVESQEGAGTSFTVSFQKTNETIPATKQTGIRRKPYV